MAFDYYWLTDSVTCKHPIINIPGIINTQVIKNLFKCRNL